MMEYSNCDIPNGYIEIYIALLFTYFHLTYIIQGCHINQKVSKITYKGVKK